MKTKIIYEDDHILVVHKPAGLATQAAGVGQPDVVSELKNYLRQPYLGVVHRLDQPVEGLLVFGKTKAAAAGLTKQLTMGSLNKYYYALICGKPAGETGELVDYLVKDGNTARLGQPAEKDAKKAVLKYRQICEWREECTLLDVEIETGRFHQIRFQLANAGFPILGDQKYGTQKSLETGNKQGIRQLSLYAYRLEFKHPATGRKQDYVIRPKMLDEIL